MLRRHVLGAAILLTPSARAETGHGDAPSLNGVDVRASTRTPALYTRGQNAFRFSQTPALGGRGYLMTFTDGRRRATADIVWLVGNPGDGWRVARRRRFILSRDEFADLAEQVDYYLAEGEPPLRRISEDGEEEILICMDGPGYLTERVHNGEATWMRGFCGDTHPNDRIAALLFGWVLDRLGD